MQAECREIQRMLWTDGPQSAPEPHLAGCSACRGEARRAADLLAALSGMRTRVAVVPADLEQTLIAAARTRTNRAREIVTHPKFWRVGAVGAAAAATAAVGLIVARRHAAARPQVA